MPSCAALPSSSSGRSRQWPLSAWGTEWCLAHPARESVQAGSGTTGTTNLSWYSSLRLNHSATRMASVPFPRMTALRVLAGIWSSLSGPERVERAAEGLDRAGLHGIGWLPVARARPRPRWPRAPRRALPTAAEAQRRAAPPCNAGRMSGIRLGSEPSRVLVPRSSVSPRSVAPRSVKQGTPR